MSCYSRYTISRDKAEFLNCKNGESKRMVEIERPSVRQLREKINEERPVDVVNASTFAVIDQGAMDKTSTMASVFTSTSLSASLISDDGISTLALNSDNGFEEKEISSVFRPPSAGAAPGDVSQKSDFSDFGAGSVLTVLGVTNVITLGFLLAVCLRRRRRSRIFQSEAPLPRFLVGAKEERKRVDVISLVYEDTVPSLENILDTVKVDNKSIYVKSKLLRDLNAARDIPTVDDLSVSVVANSISSLELPDHSVHRSSTLVDFHAEDVPADQGIRRSKRIAAGRGDDAPGTSGVTKKIGKRAKRPSSQKKK